MEPSYIRDNESGEFYRINKNTVLVRWDTWEVWKGNNKSGWVKTEDVKRKDYQEYIKASNRIFDKELIEIEDQTYFTSEGRSDKLSKKLKEEKEQHQKQEAKEKHLRLELKDSLNEVVRELEKLEVAALSIDDVKKYQAYMNNILKNLKNGQIKDTKTTREVNKNNRLELYKNTIDNYLKEGRYQSINKLCKDLGINRATLYNLKLDGYIKKSFK